jgi:hypothetical protein
VAFFLRFFVIAFAFLCACAAAGMVVAYGLRSELETYVSTQSESWVLFWITATAAGIVTPFFIFAPAFLVIALAETFNFRSVLYYLLAGGLCGVVGYFLSDPGAHLGGTGTVQPLTKELRLVAVAGIVAGFVYWLIAGRIAGKWKTIISR